jgi:hypothetical protein
MITNRAIIQGFGSEMNMSAFAADPEYLFTFFKYLVLFQVLQ